MERILIVHCGRSASGHLAELLENKGFSVDESDDFPGLSKDEPYDLVFCQAGPNPVDGLEWVRKIGQTHPELLTILVADASDSSIALDGIRAGAFDFLPAPVRVQGLEVVLARARNQHRIAKENERHRRELEKTVIDRDSELSLVRKTLTELHGLGLPSPSDDTESHLKGFADFALHHFDFDTFGVCVLENGSLEKLIFTDRFGRHPDPFVLEPTSDLYRAVLEKSPDLDEPPHEWYLQKKNRWGACWLLEHPALVGFMYAGSDHHDRGAKAARDLSHDAFRFFRNRIDTFLRERYLVQTFKQQQRRIFVASIQSHARSIEAKDIYTAGHCDRVERYSELLARQAGGFSEEWIFNLRIGAILHDIGKIGVPTALLCKPGMLSVEEQQQVQSHPVIGGRIVRTMEEFKLESSVRHHHECFDGKGYPDGLKGEAIPIEARLILAADTFDAMTSNRPYRRALSTDRAIDELKKFSGKQFDPEVVRWMVQAAPSLEEARQNSSKTVNPLKEMAEAV